MSSKRIRDLGKTTERKIGNKGERFSRSRFFSDLGFTTSFYKWVVNFSKKIIYIYI